MPNQTAAKTFRFPDGFRLSVDIGDGYEDLGMVAGGATGSLSYDIVQLDAGNYEQAFRKAKNFRFQLSPSALWNFSNRTFNKLFNGITAATAEGSGVDLDYNGTHMVDMTASSLKMSHFDEVDAHALIADDITALDADTVNDYITVAKSVFTTSLVWTTAIDGYVDIDGKHEVHVSDKNAAGSAGHFYTDATNLYFIVATGTYEDLAAAKTALTGTIVNAYKSIDWQFVLYNALIDAGSSFNFKGANEDGVNELTVSFTAEPDYANGFRLLKLFHETV